MQATAEYEGVLKEARLAPPINEVFTSLFVFHDVITAAVVLAILPRVCVIMLCSNVVVKPCPCSL